jgi:hypothetical protein
MGHRMYYEAIPGKMVTDGMGNKLSEATGSTVIQSAFSTDGGLNFELEAGVRFGQPEQAVMNYGSGRCVYLQDGRCRLYLYRRVEGEGTPVARLSLSLSLFSLSLSLSLSLLSVCGYHTPCVVLCRE